MAIHEELPPDVFFVRGTMPAGQWSQPHQVVEHHVRWRERHGEHGVAAVCDGCPGWSTGLEDGHDTDAMARLESMHTGLKVTVKREPPDA
jgi:hypothetical protein